MYIESTEITKKIKTKQISNTIKLLENIFLLKNKYLEIKTSLDNKMYDKNKKNKRDDLFNAYPIEKSQFK